jgi:hypothetical protein
MTLQTARGFTRSLAVHLTADLSWGCDALVARSDGLRLGSGGNGSVRSADDTEVVPPWRDLGVLRLVSRCDFVIVIVLLLAIDPITCTITIRSTMDHWFRLPR